MTIHLSPRALQVLCAVAAFALVNACAIGCKSGKPPDSNSGATNSDATKTSDTLPDSHSTDSAKASGTPHLRFSPSVLVTTPDSLGFVTARVYIRNDGGGTLVLSDVKASCGCAGASVQRNKITSADSGMIYLQINAKSFTQTSNNVEFTVKSNADNSPTVFRAIINLRKP